MRPGPRWLVPVNSSDGAVTFVLGHRPDGIRVGLAFTSATALRDAMGPCQESIEIADGGLRAMLAPLGVTVVQVDPILVARSPRALPTAAGGPTAGR